MKRRHVNIPIFVPHLGCPNDCIFCNQKKITGCEKYDFDSTKEQIKSQLTTTDPQTDDVQIAFFGGSFTGIERNSMISMLKIAKEYIDEGLVSSVRISTRPDYINEEILDILKAYRVTDIELGVQSMDDIVLKKAERGHSASDTINAAKLITNQGFNFVGQMMVGLPDSDLEKELFTATAICQMGARAVRIYPTLVFSGTKLAQMYQSGMYTPLSIDEAAFRCAKILKVFEDFNIPVIRLGLCETDNLRTEGSVIAGPYHPAIGELCENKYYLEEIEKQIKQKCQYTENKNLTIFVSKGCKSKAIGQKKSNTLYLKDKYLFTTIEFTEDQSMHGREILINVN